MPPLLVQVGSAETLLDDSIRITARAAAGAGPIMSRIPGVDPPPSGWRAAEFIARRLSGDAPGRGQTWIA